MKSLILIWVFICSSFSELTAKTNIIYVDRSNISDVKSIINVVERIIQENLNEDFIVYISNDKYPEILSDKRTLIRDLDVLFEIIPDPPEERFEVDTISSLINSKLQIKNTFELNEKVHLFFVLDAQTADIKNQKKKLIQRLLLINGWTNKNGLSDNVKVSAYLKRAGCQQSKINKLQEQFNDNKYEINLF